MNTVIDIHVTHSEMKSLSLWNHVNNPTECNWWLMELAYWYKSGFVLIFFGIYRTQDAKHNFM